MSAPAREYCLMWAIETPRRKVLLDTAASRQMYAWDNFRGYLGINSRIAAKKQGYKAVRVVVHKPTVAWSPFEPQENP